MHESTQWLQDTAVAPALPGLMAGLVCQLRRVLQSGWPPMARLTAIAEELDALAPPPSPAPDEGPAYGTEIARRLAVSTSPATMLFSEMAGAPVAFRVWTSGCVQLAGSEAAALDAGPGTWATGRKGTFTLDGRVLADVSSVVIMDRLPCAAVASLEAGTPLGAVLAATGCREPLSVLPWGGGIVSAARMHIGGRAVALAGEHVQPWFCRRTYPALVLPRSGDPARGHAAVTLLALGTTSRLPGPVTPASSPWSAPAGPRRAALLSPRRAGSPRYLSRAHDPAGASPARYRRQARPS